AGDLDTDALGTSALRALETLAHRTAEGDTSSKLLGDPLCNELGVSLWVLHLEDVQLNLLAGELLEIGANALGLCSTTADHNARPRGVNVDTHAVTGALDLHSRHACAVERCGE